MSNSSDSLKQVERHPEYYIAGADLHLLVGNILFRVHSFFFERDSAKFREKLGAPVAPNQARLGSSESKPIVIDNAGPTEFSKFLWVFYNPTYSLYNATAPEWTSILKIACEYQFAEVKHLAIRGLDKCHLSVVQKIHIYELYGVDPTHLIPLYAALCKRDEGPTDEETVELGMKTSLLVFRLRENVRSRVSHSSKSPLPSNLDEDDITRTICSFLGVNHTLGGSPVRSTGIEYFILNARTSKFSTAEKATL